jgi:hypothetical protein
MVVKEEDMEQWDNMEFDVDVEEDTFIPELFPEDTFADMDKLEENSQTMFLSRRSSGGNMEAQGKNSSDDREVNLPSKILNR